MAELPTGPGGGAPDAMSLARPEDAGFSRERLGRIAAFLDGEIARGFLPGAVTLVARHGRVVHFKAQGRRDPAAPDPMGLDSLFRVYSMTKPIVTAAAMMLVESGRLGLADPLYDYVPAFADMAVAVEREGRVELVPAARPITIHDLMRHTSGLTYEWLEGGPAGRAYAEREAGRRDRTNAEQAELLATLPLVSQPGTRWDYGRSTDVLGRVVEIVSGRTLGEELAASLFEPLGMLETGFQVPEAFRHRLAEAFPTDPDTGEAVRLLDVTKPVAMENGGGGLASTAPDYARFLHMITGGGTFGGHRLLSPATLGWMLSDHLGPEVTMGSDFVPPGYGFGLGFAVRRTAGHAPFPGSVGDAYWEGLAGTSFWVDPARSLYGLIMIQAPGRRARCRQAFRQLVYGALTD